MTGFVERDEPECGFVDALADGKEAVVLQDRGFAVRA
jgi:hypothetical protein